MSRIESGDPRIIVALDYDSRDSALELVDELDPALCRLKVGKEMFTRFGPDWVEVLQQRGFDVFLDLKFHDIPNTVAKAVDAAADLGVWMVNVHASGGRRMMSQAAETLARRGGHRPLLIAVTVLTSMTAEDLNDLGFSCEPEELVRRWAALSKEVGLDGVVCSARESRMLHDQLGPDFLKVTPGIRPAFAAKGDQQRVMTPSEAIAAGSDYLVVGRPVTQAEKPLEALNAIHRELSG